MSQKVEKRGENESETSGNWFENQDTVWKYTPNILGKTREYLIACLMKKIAERNYET